MCEGWYRSKTESYPCINVRFLYPEHVSSAWFSGYPDGWWERLGVLLPGAVARVMRVGCTGTSPYSSLVTGVLGFHIE